MDTVTMPNPALMHLPFAYLMRMTNNGQLEAWIEGRFTREPAAITQSIMTRTTENDYTH